MKRDLGMVCAFLAVLGLAAPLLGADDIPLSSWAAPAFWTPAKSESDAKGLGRETLAVPSSPLPFIAIAPCRLADTRDATFPAGYGPPLLSTSVPRDFTFAGRCGIPLNAQAVSANVTATEGSLPGYVSFYPADAASTGTSVVHFGAGKTRASCTIIKLSDDGTGHARLEATVPTGGTTHVVVDVSGYFD